jgi:hypothetical protein
MEKFFKFLARTLVVSFLLFSVILAYFHMIKEYPNPFGDWSLLPLVLGTFMLLGGAVILLLFVSALIMSALFAFLNWAFNTDKFD